MYMLNLGTTIERQCPLPNKLTPLPRDSQERAMEMLDTVNPSARSWVNQQTVADLHLHPSLCSL